MGSAIARVNNLANIVGVLPGIDGEQVSGVDYALNQIKAVYTVPSDKVLLLSTVECLFSDALTSNYGIVSIYDNAGALKYILGQHIRSSITSMDKHISFDPPYEMLSSWEIRAQSSDNTIYTHVSYYGVLISDDRGVL